jgi:hypothetical protein
MIPIEPAAVCVLQAVLETYFYHTVLIWVVIIAWTLYLVVVDHDFEVEGREKKFAFYAYAIPLVPALIPLALNRYGPINEVDCWI